MTPEDPDIVLLQWPHPRVGVGVCVFKNGQLLMIRRGKPPRAGEWSLPGGAQEIGETVADAGRREVLEETGVDVEILGLVDVVDLIQRSADGSDVVYHYTLVDLFADWRAGDARAGTDAAEVRWFDIAAIEHLLLWEETARVAHLALAKWKQTRR